MAVFTHLSMTSNPVVPNTGASARDYLANERTLLAWVRTAVSMIALGIALAKISEDAPGKIVGAVLACFGILMVVSSRIRYFEVVDCLERGEYKIAQGSVNLVLGMLVLISIVCVVVISFYD